MQNYVLLSVTRESTSHMSLARVLGRSIIILLVTRSVARCNTEPRAPMAKHMLQGGAAVSVGYLHSHAILAMHGCQQERQVA